MNILIIIKFTMADLEIIEQHLDIDTDNKRLRDGKKKHNKNRYFYYKNQYYIIQLTQNKWMIASDDNTTRRLLRRHTWYLCRGYAIANPKVNGKYTPTRFHRLVINCQDISDHINRMRFDNRVTNLRDVTGRENSRNLTKSKTNTSGKQGVSRDVKGGRSYWRAYICGDDGNRIMKYYSVNKLGEDTAKQLAIEKRLELERLYGYIGD
jgi:hypothetical protein